MEKLSMCRICLAEDIRLKPIVNTTLQDIYERLTDTPLETNDNRPILACYICCARLQTCVQVRHSSLKSEEMFAHMLSSNILKPAKQQETTNTNGLKVTPVIQMTIGEVAHSNSECEIKLEDPELFESVEEKQEAVEDAEGETVEVSFSGSEEKVFPKIVKQEFPDIKIINIHGAADDEESRSNNTLYDVDCNKESRNNNKNETNFNRATKDNIILDNVEGKRRQKITRSRKNKEPNVMEGTHKNIIYSQCRICGECLLSEGSLNAHMALHNDRNLHQCDICNIFITRKSNLIVHRRIHAAGKKPYKCNVCKKSFNHMSNLTRHAHTHTDEKPYQCDVCRKGFNRKAHLELHSSVHSNVRPYQCDICKTEFKRKQSLDGHSRRHTIDIRYQCDICKKIFNQKGHLDVHVRIHTGEQPYKCNYCEKSFSIKGNLFKHSLIHSGQKKYECDMCDRSFFNKSDLVRHIRVHTGEKPYKCKVCGKGFTQTGTLNKHVRTHNL